jgi:hypothetical protein
MWKLGLAIPLAVVFASTPIDPPEDGSPGGVAVLGLSAPEEVVKLAGYRCASQNCNGAISVSVGGSGSQVTGCTWDGQSTCSGVCDFCSGGSGNAFYCQQRPNETCITTGGGQFACGSIWHTSCFYSTTHALDVPCWCTNSGGTSNGDTCVINQCI